MSLAVSAVCQRVIPHAAISSHPTYLPLGPPNLGFLHVVMAFAVSYDKEEFIFGCAFTIEVLNMLEESIPLGLLIIGIKAFVCCIVDIEKP